MNRLDQCRIGMCQADWSIYIDALKILDQKVEIGLKSKVESEVEAGLKSSAKTKNNRKKNENGYQGGDAHNKLILGVVDIHKSHQWEVERSEIGGIETDKKSSDLLQSTRFAVSDFYKVGAHDFFVEIGSRR